MPQIKLLKAVNENKVVSLLKLDLIRLIGKNNTPLALLRKNGSGC